MKLLVTGSSGFVGSRVVSLAQKRNMHCICHRNSQSLKGEHSDDVAHIRLSSGANWLPVLQGVDAVVHCAAKVHQMEGSHNALAHYREVNVDGTLQLARQAAESGVKRFVFVSSVKVNGELSQPGHPFTTQVIELPQDPYGRSKYEAEQGLQALSHDTGLEVVIIRPPLVYGPGVKANFLALMDSVYKKRPLPVAAIRNKRSMVYLDNLVDLILLTLEHPQAPGNVWMVSDGHDVSTGELFSDMAKAMEVSNRTWSLPAFALKGVAGLLGKSAVAERLLGSLQVDISATQVLLGWHPPVDYHSAILQTAQAYLAVKSGNLLPTSY